MVRRIFVEKKVPFAVKAKELKNEMSEYLGIEAEEVRVLIRYDVENVSDATFAQAKQTVFSEPPVDDIYDEEFPHKTSDFCFTVEYLPGQFDQRADSAEQCVKLLNDSEEPIIKSATTYVISSKTSLTSETRNMIIKHCVNPVDSRVTDEPKPTTLEDHFDEPADVIVFDGFKDMAEPKLKELYDGLGLAMTFADFKHIQRYFHDEEHRNPTMTEIRVLDTYWSDHCRHTTFATELKDVKFDDGFYRPLIEGAFQQYLADHKEQYAGRSDKFVCLMDIGTLAAKRLKKAGILDDQEPSDEINACSIVVPVIIDGNKEEWLINFKNETHNHPTEIEPFGVAASATHFRAAPTSIRPCASPVLPTPRSLSMRPLPASCHSARLSPPPLTATAATATRLASPPASSTRCTTPTMWPSAWRLVLSLLPLRVAP